MTKRSVLYAAALALSLLGCGSARKTVKLMLSGDSRSLRERPDDGPERSVKRPPILLLLFDGVDRALLYDMLREGELPQLATLLGGSTFAHAHFDDTLLATLPSSTIPAWATVITGVAPAEHGVTGNEFFVRERRLFAAPIPTSFTDTKPAIENITSDEYAGSFLRAPTVYERMRARDPHVLVWVGMHQFYRGADVLLLADRLAYTHAFTSVVKRIVRADDKEEQHYSAYAKLDRELVDVVCDELDEEDHPLPDVLTVYLSGTDLYAHIAEEGPTRARRHYLRHVLDPEIGRIGAELRARKALADRWVVVTSDHGHTEVLEKHALAQADEDEDDPPRVLAAAGFRTRPFQLDEPDPADYQAVLAYQGGMAFVYLADRTRCADGKPCDWRRPPRYREDVLAVADAFYTANAEGKHIASMKGKLDLILTRRPRPYAQKDLPFSVYMGNDRLSSIGAYLAGHPRKDLVALDARLRDLAVGRYGERAGDIVLLARFSDANAGERHYFSTPYRSHHGSPSTADSEVPLIVAHPAHSATQISARVKRVLGPTPRQQRVADLLLSLRFQ